MRFFTLIFTFTMTFFSILNAPATPSSAHAAQHNIIKKFAPVLIFHPNEKFFPASMAWLAKRAALTKAGDKTSPRYKSFNLDFLGTYTGPEGSKYYLDYGGNKNTYYGEPLENGQVVAPCYANIVEKEDGTAIIYYAFTYAYNGPLPGLGANATGIGVHEGDLEYIYVHLKKNAGGNYALDKIFYAHHGAKSNGYYRNAKDITMTSVDQEKHPTVYVAKYGHASHYTAQKKFRVGTFDIVSDRGPQWHTWKNILIIDNPNLTFNDLPKGQKWIHTTVRLGKNGPYEFDWYKQDKQESSALTVPLSLTPIKGSRTQHTPSFNLKGKVLIRAPKICFMANGVGPTYDLSFNIKTKGPLSKEKIAYGNINLSNINKQFCVNKGELNGLYVTDLKSSLKISQGMRAINTSQAKLVISSQEH